MIFSRYNSLNYINYLNNCDINYKYFINSILETPKVEKLTLELPTNMLPNIDVTEDDYQNRLLLKCFLTLYFMNFKTPYIQCNKFKDKEIVAGTKSSFHYSYFLNYNNNYGISVLLLELFNENDSENQAINMLTKLNKNVDKQCSFFNVRAEIQAIRVSNYRDILNILFTRSELQKLKLRINIIFNNKKNKIESFTEIKQFLCLWNC